MNDNLQQIKMPVFCIDSTKIYVLILQQDECLVHDIFTEINCIV
jgi:hypothetical protein